MTDLRDQSINGIIRLEGGYTNDPNDSGGETNYGITVAVARAHGYTGSMKDMPVSVAQDIYRKKFWDIMLLDEVEAISPPVAFALFQAGVVMGPPAVGTMFQRCLDVLNQSGKLYPDIKVDGNVGPMTVATFKEYMARRPDGGDVVMVRALNSLFGSHFIELAEARQKDEDFVYGWLFKRVT